jgi:hypothetical protein
MSYSIITGKHSRLKEFLSLRKALDEVLKAVNFIKVKKVKQSHYMPWRRLGREEV